MEQQIWGIPKLVTQEFTVYESTRFLGDVSAFYWQDHKSDKVHGPFISTPQATQHRDGFTAAMKASNVIHVDFVAKKRRIF